MDSESIPEGARRAAENISQLIGLVKNQSERITVLEKHVFVLLGKMDRVETNYVSLVEIIQKRIPKIMIDTGPAGLRSN